MKSTFCLLFLFFGLAASGQGKDITNKESFAGKLAFSTGSLRTDLVANNRPIQATVFSPKLEFGGTVNLHIGGNIIRTDSGSYDTMQRTISNFEIGISAERHLTNQPFYIKGGYLFIPPQRSGNLNLQRSGHRLFAQFGFEVVDLVDFHLIASRLYDRKDVFTGTMLEFGVRIKLQ